MIWIIPLAILAIMASATMDEIRFHWKRAFAYWFRVRKSIDLKPSVSRAELWFNPSYSWNNKHQWTKNKYLQWVLSSPVVFITDFWHFLKFVLLNSIYGIITILLIDFGVWHMKWYWLIIGINFGWGIFYEFTYSVYGLLGDRQRIK